MDALKAILNKKKEELKDKKVIVRGEVEKERERQYKEELEKMEKLKEEKLKKDLEELEKYVDGGPKKKQKGNEEEKPQDKKPGEGKHEEEKEEVEPPEEPPLAKAEVFKRLRALGEPVTLFGETTWKRYKRLLALEEKLIEEKEKELGEANTFQQDLELNEEEFKRLQKIDDADFDSLDLSNLKERFQSVFASQRYTDDDGKGKRKQNIASGVIVGTKCELLYLWCRRGLKEWEQEIDSNNMKDMNTAESRKAVGTYRQCRRYVQPLLDLLKKRSLNVEILDSLFLIAYYSLEREYVKAHDKYLELAIGNAPWPMGVTMVGIHERSGRSRIFTNQIAHILNDETQRKYLQSVKRLLTFAQKKYPANPSKMVFN